MLTFAVLVMQSVMQALAVQSCIAAQLAKMLLMGSVTWQPAQYV